MDLIVFLFCASPIIVALLFALLIDWIMKNFKKIEANENII
jgi:hypothetical protein